MAEYTCCSSVAFERPNEDTLTFTFTFLPPTSTHLHFLPPLPPPLSPLPTFTHLHIQHSSPAPPPPLTRNPPTSPTPSHPLPRYSIPRVSAFVKQQLQRISAVLGRNATLVDGDFPPGSRLTGPCRALQGWGRGEIGGRCPVALLCCRRPQTQHPDAPLASHTAPSSLPHPHLAYLLDSWLCLRSLIEVHVHLQLHLLFLSSVFERPKESTMTLHCTPLTPTSPGGHSHSHPHVHTLALTHAHRHLPACGTCAPHPRSRLGTPPCVTCAWLGS
jgi:hypothetical protein